MRTTVTLIRFGPRLIGLWPFKPKFEFWGCMLHANFELKASGLSMLCTVDPDFGAAIYMI